MASDLDSQSLFAKSVATSPRARRQGNSIRTILLLGIRPQRHFLAKNVLRQPLKRASNVSRASSPGEAREEGAHYECWENIGLAGRGWCHAFGCGACRRPGADS